MFSCLQLSKVVFVVVLAIILYPTLVQNSEPVTQLVNSIEATRQWNSKLKSYDVEVTVRREQSVAREESNFSIARVIREVVDASSTKFSICDCEGFWYLNAIVEDSRDTINTHLVFGDSESARGWSKGFSMSSVACDGSCLEKSGIFKWPMIPVKFILPVDEKYEQAEYDSFLELILTNRKTRVELTSGKVKHFGEERTASIYRVFMELKFEQGANGKDYIGREVHVADSGDDKGMVLTMSQFSLKGDSAEPFEKGNIVHRERFVSTKWSKKKFADDEFVVPIEIRQEFSQGGSKDTLTQSKRPR
jgi:hypothetical protein